MKIFGKLTRPQFVRVFRAQPEVGRVMNSLRQGLTKSGKAKEWRRERGELVWATLYELPLERIAAIWFVVSGQAKALKEAAMAPAPQEAALEWAERIEPEDDPPDVSPQELMMVSAALIALIYSWMAVGWYSATLSTLIGQAKAGDDEALFKAISVDPSCVVGPTGAGRLSRALFRSENQFLKRLRKELKGPNRLRYTYSRQRVAEFILRDAGAFQVRGNREEIFEAVTDDLGLAMKRDGDPFKAWTSRVRAWQKEAMGKSTI